MTIDNYTGHFNTIKSGGGGGGGTFTRGKVEFKLFMNGLWYDLETL